MLTGYRKPSMAPQGLVAAGSCHCPGRKRQRSLYRSRAWREYYREDHPIGVVIFIKECGDPPQTELERLWTSTFLSSLLWFPVNTFLWPSSSETVGPGNPLILPIQVHPSGLRAGQTEGIHRPHRISLSCLIWEMLQMLNSASWL